MKTCFPSLALVLAALTSPAQYIVYDPTSNAQQIADQAVNLAKYLQMVNNQIQQLNQLQQYNLAFGNPAQILNVSGVQTLTNTLAQLPLGQTIAAVEQTIDGGQAALNYDANGLFHQIGATFTTPSGNQIQRVAANYKPNEAINNATANYSNVTASVVSRRQALKAELAATTAALQAATTASDVQKLTGVLIGQSAALAATDKEADQAVAVSVEQDIENRNDAQKQATAAQEQQQAEVVEAFANYRTNFQLNVQPPLFQASSTNIAP